QAQFVKVADVQSFAVIEFLGTLRGQGKSVKTANDYLAAVKGFTRWLWRDKRTVLDALAGLSKLANGETDVRHARRDISPDELGLLFEAAQSSPDVIRCLPGPDRHFLYLTACATGFRVSELASMIPESFSLDGDTLTATVQASCTKNKKLAVQPLPLGVADMLREYLREKPAGAIIWPGNPKAPAESWRLHGAEMIRTDLAEARRKWLQTFQDDRQRAEAERSDFLVYRDAAGRYADFHALRHSFITMVGKSGVSPREHQDLARHSTYALTSKYSHSRLYDLAAAVHSLPIPTTGKPEAEALKATGTDGKADTKNHVQAGKISLGPFLGPQPAILRDSQRQAETESTKSQDEANRGKTKETLSFPAVSAGKKNILSRYPQGDSNPCLSRERAMS